MPVPIMPPPAPPLQLPASPASLRAALLGWYDRHRRKLPWRAEGGDKPDAYAVLVSEVMLQQTTAATVGPRFADFMARFPSLPALAAASLEEVLHAWQGLGYYRRARALHECARAVMQHFAGVLPKEEAALRALPGVGPYTAAAVAAIAHDRPAVPVDGNVERVLARLASVELPMPAARKPIGRLAAGLASTERPGDLAQALMDLGATICTPRRPSCLACPWRGPCRAQARGIAERLPQSAAKRLRPERKGVAFLLARSDGAVLFRRRSMGGLLPGMMELPASPWDRPGPPEDEGAAPLAHAPIRADWRMLPGEVRHVFTHFALTLKLARAEAETGPAGLWIAPEKFHELALPTLTRKLLVHAGLALPTRPPQRRQAPSR
jgi:A/G-specific adenine glycosylase